MCQALCICCLLYSVQQTSDSKNEETEGKVTQVVSGATKIQTLWQCECRTCRADPGQFGYVEVKLLWDVTLSCPGVHVELEFRREILSHD